MKTRIKQLRQEKGLTLKQLGQLLNIRDNTLSQYETDKRNPPLGLLQEIANFFSVSIEYLTFDSEKRDYPIKNKADAIKILKQINDRNLTYSDLSKLTSLELALWVTTNFEYIKKEHKDLVSTSYYFVKDIETEYKALRSFTDERIANNNAINEIEKLLESEEYYGASPTKILEFMKQSDRIGFENTKKILDKMKNTKTYDPEKI